jgi:hypothetical protein
MVAASAEPEIQNVNALAVAQAPNGGATLVSSPSHRVGREWAATANAVAAIPGGRGNRGGKGGISTSSSAGGRGGR